jgi:hypothetical protein
MLTSHTFNQLFCPNFAHLYKRILQNENLIVTLEDVSISLYFRKFNKVLNYWAKLHAMKRKLAKIPTKIAKT